MCIYHNYYRAFTPNPGTDFISPGLVRDGIKCGEDKVSLYSLTTIIKFQFHVNYDLIIAL